MTPRSRWPRVALFAVLAAVVLAAYASGIADELRPDAIRSLLREAGSWSVPLFWLLFVVGEIVAIPSVVFVIVAGITWPREAAFAISWAGSVLSATVVFVLALSLIHI